MNQVAARSLGGFYFELHGTTRLEVSDLSVLVSGIAGGC